MSTSYQSDYARAVQRKIIWDETRCKAAALLAKGYPKSYVAEQVGISRNTVYAWLDDPDFAEEVDRLTMMTGVANRSERIRLAMRVVRSRINKEGVPKSEKDILDWLKFAQSETTGAKIDLSKLAELLTGETSDNQEDRRLLSPAPDLDQLVQPQDTVGPSDTEHNSLLAQAPDTERD